MKQSSAPLFPLLKWPGGKRGLLKRIVPLIPIEHGTYYEPFVGGGAMFFGLRPQNAVLGDFNADLVNCYVQVRDNCEDVIEALATMPNSHEDYLRIRSEELNEPVLRAARLLYLTSLSFNGIYRLNRDGKFNVPYGHRTHLQPCDPHRLRSASLALKGLPILCGDFAVTVERAGRGDVVYFDPPYTVAHSNNGFLRYNDRIFSWADQVRLATLSTRLVERGCTVLVSNAHHPSLLQLYQGFNRLDLQRSSTIAASADHRTDVVECLFYRQGAPDA